MASEYVTIARTSAGAHGRAPPDDPVEIPVDDLRDARGLIAGSPDAGIEDSTAVLVDRLLAAGQSVLLVDADGSHRDLARRHGARLAGDDPDCDVRLSRGNADRIATVVGENDESVVIDCSSFGADPHELLRSIATALGRLRRRRTSAVVVLTACHQWLPDAGESACAEALDALGRTDTAPGVGVVGVTDRPSGVDAGYRRECDWIAAHRVSWRDHVDAVARILGRRYADALEDLDDGEAFLDGPWASAVQRARFDSVETDAQMAGDRSARAARSPDRSRERHPRTADGGERPQSDVDVLADELATLRDRIDDLEATIDDRNDVETIAGDLADAIAERLDDHDVAARRSGTQTESTPSVDLVETDRSSAEPDRSSDGPDDADESGGGGFGNVFDAFDAAGDGSDSAGGGAQAASATGGSTASRSEGPSSSSSPSPSSSSSSPSSSTSSPSSSSPSPSSGSRSTSTRSSGGSRKSGSSDSGGMSFEPANFAFDEGVSGGETSPDSLSPRRSRRRSGERRIPRYVRDLVRIVEEMDPTTRSMLAHYVDRGADTPMNAHFSAGGSDDRTSAYAHNRQLRTTGFIEHVGRGHYAPTIPEKVREEADSGLSTEAVKKATEHIRRALP